MTTPNPEDELELTMATTTQPQPQGRVMEGFSLVREAFESVVKGTKGGMALSVYQDGAEVVTLAGGTSAATGEPFTEDSVVMTMSCTKGMASLCTLMLVEQGLLDLETPVSQYWPEFAAAGKGRIPVRWLLTHQAGLPALDPDFNAGPDQTLDDRVVVHQLERQVPLWEPGTRQAYHAVTFGHLIGELVRRVSGQSLGEYFAAHVAQPLGLDYWIGLPASQEERYVPNVDGLAMQVDPNEFEALLRARGIDPHSRLMISMASNHFAAPGDQRWNTRPYHKAEFPAVNGIGTARALARAYSAMINEVDGVRLLSQETIELARQPQTDKIPLPEELDLLTGGQTPRRGLGFELPRADVVPMLGSGSFGHSGAGGRLAFAHPELGLAVGFTCDVMLWNGMDSPDPRWGPLMESISACIATQAGAASSLRP